MFLFRHTIFAGLVAKIGAFAPMNGNIHTNNQVRVNHEITVMQSSANRGDLGDDSLGFFDDGDDNFNKIMQLKGAFQFIFEVDEDDKPEDVHIILFNPDTDREGVHSIEFPKDSGHNMILAFESKAECEQFSRSLKEQHFFDPTPQEMKLEFLENYCEQIGVEVQVVPEGMKLKPPTESTLNLGVNPNLEEEVKMLDYLFQISSSNDESDAKYDNFDSMDGSDGTEGAWE
jgi:hypothetical protein